MGSLPGLTRRRDVLALAATCLLPASLSTTVLASLASIPSPSSNPLAGFVPLWHPLSSGYNTDESTVIQRKTGSGLPAQRVLTGLGVHLWSLCDGAHDYGQIVDTLTGEFGLEQAPAAEIVSAFVSQLSREGFVIDASKTRMSFGTLCAACEFQDLL